MMANLAYTTPEFELRKRTSHKMESALNALSEGSALMNIGFKDSREMRNIIIKARRRIDDCIFHYVSNGARVIPAGEDFVPSNTAWVFVYLYIMLTRLNLDRGHIRSLCEAIARDGNVVDIPRLLLNFVSNRGSWKNHQSLCMQVAQLAGWEASRVFSNDHEDILCVAAFFGFRRIDVVNIDHVNVNLDSKHLEEVAEAVPPLVSALFDADTREKFYRAMGINRGLMGSSIMGPRMVSVAVPEQLPAKIIHAYLVSIGGIVDPNMDDDTRATIDTYISFARRTTLEAVPYKKDLELDRVFMNKLNLDVDAFNSPEIDGIALRMTHLLALSASPTKQVNSIN